MEKSALAAKRLDGSSPARLAAGSRRSRARSGFVCDADGGGIYNAAGGTVLISNSTLSGNRALLSCKNGACNARGGGVANFGRLTINNNTLSGNRALIYFPNLRTGGFGGGIFNHAGGTVTVGNSTLSGNSGVGGGGGIANGGPAGW